MAEADPEREPETAASAAGADSWNDKTSLRTELDSRPEAPTVIIGPYRLLQRIAEGGMGEVWLAEQKQPVRRRVALKLIRAGMDTREIVLRFESERQALALMDHPAIAKVYDAGTTPDGKPYFVMEYVQGVSIATYCETHHLSVYKRLELFIHVCEGVQHAHQKAIIHRDLKPSNILVAEVDGRPAPKIIDFGVAKAMSQRLIEQTMFTRVGSIIGTPEYMSPEQAGSGGEDIDTRSDVYSLGVILFELLARVPPLDLKASGYLEFVRKLHDTATPKPSTKVRSLASAAEAGAKDRSAELNLLANELRGDLDCITLKCLEKDRNRRYGSPAELAADIQRYLNHQPVLARPASAGYRFQKFAQRNRGLVMASCGMVLMLIAGTCISTYQAIRAHQAERAALVQRDRADSEAATVAAVSDFLQKDLLLQAGADQQSGGASGPDPDVKVRTLVDRAAAALSTKLKGKPLIEADLRKTLGDTYVSLGLMNEAKAQLQRAYELDAKERGASSLKTLEALAALGSVEFDSGHYADAARLQADAYHRALRTLGPDHPFTLQSMQSLAVDWTLLGQLDEAEPLLKKVLAAQIRHNGYDNDDTLNTSDSLAYLYIRSGRYGEAKTVLERGLESYRKLYGPEHPNTQREVFGLARVLLNTGDYAQAEHLAADVYQSNRRLLGPHHFKTLATTNTLAQAYQAQGKLKDAEAMMRDTLRDSTAISGENSDLAFNARQILAGIYDDKKEYGKAEALLRENELKANQVYAAESPDATVATQLLGINLLQQRRCGEAAHYLAAATERWRAYRSFNWRRFEAQIRWGEALTCQKESKGAEAALLEGYNGVNENLLRLPARQRGLGKTAAADLAQLYAGSNQIAQVQHWQTLAK